ncbi:MAG: hypothetical protein JWM11_286 [Planctomycetaceae bacterium]|nr:hypothetical protein [Planctomycetaceae bacterium]
MSSSTVLDSKLASSQVATHASASEIPESAPPAFSVRKFSVAEYELLNQYNILGEDDNVELLEGWISEKRTKNPQHTLVLENLFWALHQRLPAGFYVRNQEPITTEDSVPEPDLAITLGNRKDYGDRHPAASEVVLIIEVADSSISKDRRKSGLYARSGINPYWIVNLLERCVEIYSNPVSGEATRYAEQCRLSIDDIATIRLSERLSISLPVAEFLSS